MATKKTPAPSEDESMADDSLSSARSLLTRVTGEKMPNRVLGARAAAGGVGRAAKLSPERRSAIAAKAAAGRWKK
jgi:hypothetical protein